jgi:hypothetical protein
VTTAPPQPAAPRRRDGGPAGDGATFNGVPKKKALVMSAAGSGVEGMILNVKHAATPGAIGWRCNRTSTTGASSRGDAVA